MICCTYFTLSHFKDCLNLSYTGSKWDTLVYLFSWLAETHDKVPLTPQHWAKKLLTKARARLKGLPGHLNNYVFISKGRIPAVKPGEGWTPPGVSCPRRSTQVREQPVNTDSDKGSRPEVFSKTTSVFSKLKHISNDKSITVSSVKCTSSKLLKHLFKRKS